MTLVDPVIVVPGITATYLHDEYTLPPENLWTVMTKRYERVAMHPDNLGYEAIEPAVVRSGQVFEIAYEELIEELRYNLSPAADKPVSVYPFGYDWRHPLDELEAAFAEFVEEVIERTKLVRHYYENGYHDNPRVNLIGHSMGGLIITGYLDTVGKKAPVNKVATLATPYRGSYEAVIKVITGTADLGTKAPSSRERESARLTPALYHLLPSFSKAVITPPDLPNSLYDPGVWQPTVAESIAEFVRLHGLPKTDRRTKTARREDADRLLAGMLTLAKKHRARIDQFALAKAGLTRKDWLAVIGVGSETRIRLEVVKGSGGPQFNFKSDDRRDEWGNPNNKKARNTGDGTVPFEGALPGFLDETDIVCVTPDDFGYWELQDKALARLAGLHGILPNMNMLHRLLVRFFTGSADRRGNTWGRGVPGVTKSQWNPPLKLTYKEREIEGA
jgi:pimeloyl-ACP methyl ester carboxylesterase